MSDSTRNIESVKSVPVNPIKATIQVAVSALRSAKVKPRSADSDHPWTSRKTTRTVNGRKAPFVIRTFSGSTLAEYDEFLDARPEDAEMRKGAKMPTVEIDGQIVWMSYAFDATVFPDLPPSEVSPEAPADPVAEIIAERVAIATDAAEKIRAILNGPTFEERIDSIAREIAAETADTVDWVRKSYLDWEKAETYYSRAALSAKWLYSGKDFAETRNRFLDLIGFDYDWHDEDNSQEPDSWRWARFVELCVSGQPILNPALDPEPTEDDDDFVLVGDDEEPFTAPEWAEDCYPSGVSRYEADTPMLERTSQWAAKYGNSEISISTTNPLPGFSGATPCPRLNDATTAKNRSTIRTTSSTATNAETPAARTASSEIVSASHVTIVRESSCTTSTGNQRGTPRTILIDGSPYAFSIEPGGITLTKPDGTDHVVIDGLCSCKDAFYRERRCKHVSGLIAGGLLPAPAPVPIFPEPTEEDWAELYASRAEMDDDHDTPSGWEIPVPEFSDEEPMPENEPNAIALLASLGIQPVSGGAPEEVENPVAVIEPKGEFRQAKPDPRWPIEISMLIRFYVAAKGEKLDPCAACGSRKRGRWTMLCPFQSHGLGQFKIEKLGDHPPLALVCSDHPISPSTEIQAAI